MFVRPMRYNKPTHWRRLLPDCHFAVLCVGLWACFFACSVACSQKNHIWQLRAIMQPINFCLPLARLTSAGQTQRPNRQLNCLIVVSVCIISNSA